jgi:hypothetical protein
MQPSGSFEFRPLPAAAREHHSDKMLTKEELGDFGVRRQEWKAERLAQQ